MPYTREEYVSIGEQLRSQFVVHQLNLSLELAGRDATPLTSFGWSPTDTRNLAALRDEHVGAMREYERKFGTHIGRTETTAVEVDLAKRWRLRCLAIGENRLTDKDALATLRRAATRAGRDAEKLAAQIDALLAVAKTNETAFRTDGAADDGFYAEGNRLCVALKNAAAARRDRPKNLSAEHDKLDELDGRAWELLKKVSLAGKSLHAANGDRARVAEYNLDLLYGRPIIRTTRTATPAPTSGSGTPTT